jgi:hypothetical protein
MKRNQDQFTSTKFIGTFILNQDMIACLIDKTMIVQIGQWVRFDGQNHQIIGVSYFGVSLKRGEFIQLVTVENSHPYYRVITDYSLPPRPPSLPLYAQSTPSLPLIALAGAVLLLLLTLIY